MNYKKVKNKKEEFVSGRCDEKIKKWQKQTVVELSFVYYNIAYRLNRSEKGWRLQTSVN